MRVRLLLLLALLVLVGCPQEPRDRFASSDDDDTTGDDDDATGDDDDSGDDDDATGDDDDATGDDDDATGDDDDATGDDDDSTGGVVAPDPDGTPDCGCVASGADSPSGLAFALTLLAGLSWRRRRAA